ncbi:MAG: chaperone modulator CbpM [Gammaproteobacteria bacterium]
MSNDILKGTLLDELDELSIDQLAEICSCRTEWIMELVEEGIVEPYGQEPAEWRFAGVSVTRVRTAMRLHRDLEVNLAGIALAIDLLEEVSELQARLKVIDPESG